MRLGDVARGFLPSEAVSIPTARNIGPITAASNRSQCRPRHRHQEFLGCLRTVEAGVTKQLDIHVIVHNYSTHKHAQVKASLAARPRWHLHFTPTYGSWPNQIEPFFGLITDNKIGRGSFQSVKERVDKIINVSPNTTKPANLSHGQLLSTRYWPTLKDLLHESAGQHSRMDFSSLLLPTALWEST